MNIKAVLHKKLTEGEFAFGEMPKEEVPTMLKLTRTAVRDGIITKDEASAMYIMDAAKKIAAEFDALPTEEKKVFRDAYWNKFLKMIGKQRIGK